MGDSHNLSRFKTGADKAVEVVVGHFLHHKELFTKGPRHFHVTTLDSFDDYQGSLVEGNTHALFTVLARQWFHITVVTVTTQLPHAEPTKMLLLCDIETKTMLLERKYVASELKDPICHSNECQICSFSSEATSI